MLVHKLQLESILGMDLGLHKKIMGGLEIWFDFIVGCGVGLRVLYATQ